MDGNEELAWGIEPPEPGLPWVKLRSPQAGHPAIKLVVIGHTVEDILVHFVAGPNGKISRPCKRDRKKCELCQGGLSPRWKGYIACQDFDGVLCVLEITRNAYDTCLSLHKGVLDLRGHTITAWRQGKHRNAPVICNVSAKADNAHLKEPFDVRAAMLRLWFGDGKGKRP